MNRKELQQKEKTGKELQQKEKKMVFDHLDNLYAAVKIVCNNYDTDKVPIITIETVVEKSFVNTDNKNEGIRLFLNNYNNTLKVLIETCKNLAKSMDTTKIPLQTFEFYIEHIKTHFATAIPDEPRIKFTW